MVMSKKEEPTAHAKAAGGWTGSFKAQTEESFAKAFDPNVKLEATALLRDAVGAELVQTIMGEASRQYEFVDFIHEAKEGNHSFLEWRARFKTGEPVSGITILTTTDEGKITGIAIHHRPLATMLRFSHRLYDALKGKVPDDLFFKETPPAWR
jgi:hypothetical protein